MVGCNGFRISAALAPLIGFTDMLSGEEYISVSVIKPPLKHLRDMLLNETDGQPKLTGNIKHGLPGGLVEQY